MTTKTSMLLNLRKVTVSQDALALLPATLARRLGCLPLGAINGTLSVAMNDPSDYGVLDQIQRHTGLEIHPLPIADPNALDAALQRYYPLDVSDDENTPALFRRILHRGVQIRASDIHFDPAEDGSLVLLRVDGSLRRDRSLTSAVHMELVSLIKVMAGLDIAERRLPQDGQFEIESAGERISLRVATLPVIHGEKVTLRLLFPHGEESLSGLDTLGMNERHYEIFTEALNVSNGILLLTGPTGSGKTTTLYAALRRLGAPGEAHILSIEDPVEISIPGINQVRVRHEDGLTGFHVALRSALRHDPDIIMIGEIRDAESADIAVKAALTGHLVLSTLHTNDALSVVTRLENLDVPPYLIASSLRLAAAQRLVRTPCPHCVVNAHPSADLVRRLGLEADEKIAEVRGCAFFGGIGYTGRIGLFEMVLVDDSLREMILERQGELVMKQHVFGDAENATLLDDGVQKIRNRITTAIEVDRAVQIGV